MREYLLLLPILFIFHDMEEIIGSGWFFRNNPEIFERFPKTTKAYKEFTTAGMALAVYEEFIPFFGISLLAYYLNNDVLYTIWFGLLISLTTHFVVHIGQSIYVKKYIPSLITSIICFPISIVILINCKKYMVFNLPAIILIAGSILLMMANLKLAHWLMNRFGKLLI